MVGGEPETPSEAPGEEFARGHYEQLVAGAGTITVGDDTWQVDGFGLRDHSWGPRYWQAPWYYRWLTANFGAEFGFMGSRIASRQSEGIRGGFVWDGNDLHHCNTSRSLPPGQAPTATTSASKPGCAPMIGNGECEAR
jgi:hypothetical protein